MGTQEFQQLFQSITVDDGGEFLNWRALETSALDAGTQRTALYYCHPYSAFERGSNEHANGILRRHIPKGSDISDYSTEDIQEVEDWTNDYPRRILGGLSASEKIQKNISQVATLGLKVPKRLNRESVAV